MKNIYFFLLSHSQTAPPPSLPSLVSRTMGHTLSIFFLIFF